MKNYVLISTILISFVNSISNSLFCQAYTNIFFGDSILYHGDFCNKVINGKNEGLHYSFTFDYVHSIIHTDYIDFSSSTKIIYARYRELYDSVNHKIISDPKQFTSENGDTIIANYWTHDVKYSSKGKYKSGLKNGTWKYYYPEGQLWAQMILENDIPVDTVTIYNIDGSIKAIIHSIGNGLFYDCRLDKNGEFKDCDTTETNDDRTIFH